MAEHAADYLSAVNRQERLLNELRESVNRASAQSEDLTIELDDFVDEGNAAAEELQMTAARLELLAPKEVHSTIEELNSLIHQASSILRDTEFRDPGEESFDDSVFAVLFGTRDEFVQQREERVEKLMSRFDVLSDSIRETRTQLVRDLRSILEGPVSSP